MQSWRGLALSHKLKIALNETFSSEQIHAVPLTNIILFMRDFSQISVWLAMNSIEDCNIILYGHAQYDAIDFSWHVIFSVPKNLRES